MRLFPEMTTHMCLYRRSASSKGSVFQNKTCNEALLSAALTNEKIIRKINAASNPRIRNRSLCKTAVLNSSDNVLFFLVIFISFTTILQAG